MPGKTQAYSALGSGGARAAEGGGFLPLKLGPEGGKGMNWDVGVRAEVAPAKITEAKCEGSEKSSWPRAGWGCRGRAEAPCGSCFGGRQG